MSKKPGLLYIWDGNRIIDMALNNSTTADSNISAEECEIFRIFKDNQRLELIIKAVEEWAIADMNDSLLGFIRKTKECKSAEEIENKLKR